MARTYNRLEIDVNKKPNSIGIRPVQNDTKSRYLDVCLYENGVPINLTGEQVRITFRKADGSTFFNQGEVTDATAGRCQFALTNEILSEAKVVEAQISVWNAGGQILSTQVFEIYVTAAIPWTDAVESENEYGVLVVLFQEIQNALDTMHKIAAAFGEPGDKAAEYGVDTFWGILETLAGRGDVESSLQKGIKAYLNSTVGTSGFQSLDMLTSAKILLKGVKDETFHFVNEELNLKFDVSMDESTPVGNSGWRELLIPVALGRWNITATISNVGSITEIVNVQTVGVTYVLSYTLQSASPIAEITSTGNFTVPNEVEGVVVYACGAGGGGAGGCWIGGSAADDSGGGAGGGGAAAVKRSLLLSQNRTLQAVIGTGGTGGAESQQGSDGGPTVLTGFLSLTLPGGVGGGIYKSPSPGIGGAAGGTGGGKGGNGGYRGYKVEGSPAAGTDGLLGVGGSSSGGGNAGGGGGGSLGNGGNGASGKNNSATAGDKGGGGGGGYASYTSYNSNIGANGGNGIVLIFKGVSV